jgi:hypothetical protein
MTIVDFIERLRVAVNDTSIEGTLSLLEKPPGRRPSPALVELSDWIAQLSPDDRERIQAIVTLAVRGTVFNLLAVLDGTLAICRNEEEPGHLELRHTIGEHSVLLNDPNGEPLHDVFAQQVPPM